MLSILLYKHCQMKNYLRKILITGANGQLGTCLREHPASADFQLSACTRAELDITDITSIQHAIATAFA